MRRGFNARNGVARYWLVDPEDEAVEILRLEDGAYLPEAYFTGDATLTTPAPSGLSIPLVDALGSSPEPSPPPSGRD